MWFKNLSIYRFNEPFTIAEETLESQLQSYQFSPCKSHDLTSQGWVSPMPKNSESLVHISKDTAMLCLKQQEKLLPSAVINQTLDERVTEKETQENRSLGRKEKTELKEIIISELIPQAFSVSKSHSFYIDFKQQYIIVNSSSAKKAEDIISYLRKTLGSLPTTPWNATVNPAEIMTQWLKHEQKIPSTLSLEDECELQSSQNENGIIKCKGHDLSLPEITNHIEHDKRVKKLALNWQDRLSFVLDENLAIKRLKFLDLIQDKLEEIEEDESYFNASFAIMTAEITKLISDLDAIFRPEESRPDIS